MQTSSKVFTLLLVFAILFAPVSSYSSNEIWSVLAGYPVTYSTRNKNHDCSIFRLDIPNYAFSAEFNNINQWVQVSSINPEIWTAIVTQGRSNADQWISQYQVSYTLNGKEWTFIEHGKLFKGNSDRNSWVRNNFEDPVIARAIRIHPTKWFNYISFRFDAIHQRL